MNNATKAFLKAAYREYYLRKSNSVEYPGQVEAREFGYIPFGGSMVRHLAFKSVGEATAEILRQAPSSVYCSNARYESPAAPMEEKGWRGAELIFDIDATDIPTTCKRSHDVWLCPNCHAAGRLPKPQKCPKCSAAPNEFKGTCAVCIGASREHTIRLTESLVADFGVSKEEIMSYFSGNRGFHVHVSDDRFLPLDQEGRSEIAGFMRGDGLPAYQSIASNIRRRPASSVDLGVGWTRKVNSYVETRRKGYPGTILKLVSEAITSNRSLVDASVTTDIHRVFRLAGTLHGDTGMCKLRVNSLDDFDASAPVVLSAEPVKVSVNYSPKISLNGEEFGPFTQSIQTLPTYAAVSILTRGFGEVA